MVSLMAYAGLRPGEALALRWGDVRERTIVVERSVSLGEVKPTKTGAVRTVRMLSPLIADISRWRLASGRGDADTLIFPGNDGRVWNEDDYKNWRRRKFKTAVLAAGLPARLRPYDLRHAFCSLLIAEGRSIVEVAAQMGHAPTMTLNTYGHVIADMDGVTIASAEEAIKAARPAPHRALAASAKRGQSRR